MLASPLAQAESLACDNSLDTQLGEEAQMPAAAVEDESAVELAAGEFDAVLGPLPGASMSGGVLLRRGNKLAGADQATFYSERRTLYLDGNVRYEDSGTRVRSDSAEFSYESGRIEFKGAEFSLGGNNARGAAGNILINREGQLKLDNVSYTTCPQGSNDWLLEASDIDLDSRSGIGVARGMKLRFQGIPILYAPYLSFPISNARKSGILTPEVGSSDRSGNDVSVPFYWNIAPNYDATITPRLLTDRGLQLQTEFRYLTRKNSGIATAQYLQNDSLTGAKRQLWTLTHRTDLDDRWRARIDFSEVSDNQYFEDLGGSLSASSITHLNRSLRFDWHSDTMAFLGRLQNYQTLDDAIRPPDEPYQRLPQLLFSGRWPGQVLGLSVAVDAEIVNFDKEVGVTGWRANLAPRIELPIEYPGWFVNPALAWDYTRYELANTPQGVQSDPGRSVPIASIDTGLILERSLGNGPGAACLGHEAVTVEARPGEGDEERTR